jgi:hypothetical protein
VSADIGSGEGAEHRKFAYNDVLNFVAVPGETVITPRSPAATDATEIPTSTDAAPNSQPQSTDNSAEMELVPQDAGLDGRAIAMWSTISFGGLAAALFGFAMLRMLILRRVERSGA